MGSSSTSRATLDIDIGDGKHSEDTKALFQMQASTQQNITKVRIDASWEGDGEDRIDLYALFGYVGRLENLQQLHVLSCDDSGMSLPVALLANVLKQSPKLQMMCMDSVSLEGEEEDFDALAKAVWQNTTLSCVCMFNVQLQSNNTPFFGLQQGNLVRGSSCFKSEAHCLEPFLVALAQACPAMQVLELEGVPISVTALKAIGSSSRLRDVELWNIPSVGEHIQDFAAILQTNASLEKLKLCNCVIGPHGGECLTNMLLQNSTLTSVVLEIDWGKQVMFGKPIASILQFNNTLTRLHLICRQKEQSSSNNAAAEAYAEMICSSLIRNTTLQRLVLEFRQNRFCRNDNSRLAAAFADPFRKTLQQNCTLHEFALMGGSSTVPVVWREDVAFHLHLNNVGRKQWMSAFFDNPSGWMDALLEHNDLSTLFYLLSLHPHLVTPSDGSVFG